MHPMFKFRLTVAGLLLLTFTLSCAGQKNHITGPDPLPGNSPANASYRIENNWIQLENGRAQKPAAPGSASLILVTAHGDILFRDITNDGDDDAVLFLTYQGGGSGTFYYLTAALYEKGGYQGTNGIFLGDRISSPVAKVKNGLITVEFYDRMPDESMTAPPSISVKRFFILSDSRLQEIKLGADDTIYQGLLAIGYEAGSFLPCDDMGHPLLLNQSPDFKDIIEVHGEKKAGLEPQRYVFAILAGRKTVTETAAGSKYAGAVTVTQIIKIWPRGNCRSDYIHIDSPLPGEEISSPLTLTGQARGIWFFEGDFPIILLDGQGREIALGYVSAKGEWMTKNFVGFQGLIRFDNTFSGRKGTLVLKKDNPTGLAQFDDILEIPVNFK